MKRKIEDIWPFYISCAYRTKSSSSFWTGGVDTFNLFADWETFAICLTQRLPILNIWSVFVLSLLCNSSIEGGYNTLPCLKLWSFDRTGQDTAALLFVSHSQGWKKSSNSMTMAQVNFAWTKIVQQCCPRKHRTETKYMLPCCHI